METLTTFWHWLTTSRYTRFLEAENARLWDLLAELQERPVTTETPARRTQATNERQPRPTFRTWSSVRRKLENGPLDVEALAESARAARIARKLEEY